MSIQEIQTDDSLMARLKQGDIDALGVLFERHGAMTARAIRRFAPHISDDEVRDLVQDVFLKVRRLSRNYTALEKCSAWIFGIAANTAGNWKKKGAKRATLLAAHREKSVGLSLVVDNSPEAAVANRELVERILDTLSSEDQRLFVLSEVDGFSAREIGEMVGLKEGAVWTRLHRIRNTLLGKSRQPRKRDAHRLAPKKRMS